MTTVVRPSETNPLRRRAGCPDLDPNWPDIFGNPRGPRVCTLYPNCECGNEDRVMSNSENAQLPSNERCINWPCQLPRAHTGPCSTEGKQSQRVSDVRLHQLLRMGACLSNEAVDDMRLAIGELLERRSHETVEYRKWPGEPPHCMSCDCGMTDEQKRTVPLDDYLRIHRELIDMKYPGTAWDPNRCFVCGGNHGNLPCPQMTVTAQKALEQPAPVCPCTPPKSESHGNWGSITSGRIDHNCPIHWQQTLIQNGQSE